MVDSLTRKMMDLGFTQYEAKAYIALLRNHPATRYELSKLSGVPRSAIYDVIHRLESQGAVNALATKPEKYIPLPPEKLMDLLESRYQSKVRELRTRLSEIDLTIEMGHLWNITGYDNLILKCRELINQAQREIYLSGWRREILKLENELRQAVDRGVKVVIFSFTRIPSIGHVFSYGLEEEDLARVWDPRIILVRDMEELVMGDSNLAHSRKVAWTDNRAIVEIAANHVVLDITLFGLRMGVDIGEAVIEQRSGELDELARLLSEKYPDNPWFNLQLLNNPRALFEQLADQEREDARKE